MKGYIRRILNSSAVDGPGNRMVIFLQGCNFNCTYCHNPETIQIYNSKFDENNDSEHKMEIVDADKVISKIVKIKPFISGVTISGGECTIQYEFLLEFAKKMKEKGISLYVDTNGYLPKEKMETLAQYVDKFMLDIKAVNEQEHMDITGKSNTMVLENLDLLASIDKLYEVRTVVIPEVINNKEIIEYVGYTLNKYDSNTRYKIIMYRNHGVRKNLVKTYKPPTLAYMENLKLLGEQMGLTNIIIT